MWRYKYQLNIENGREEQVADRNESAKWKTHGEGLHKNFIS